MGTLQEGLQKLKDAYENSKSVSEREDEMKAKVKPGVPPARLSKKQMEEIQLKNERSKDPKGYDKREQSYKSAQDMEAEDYSPVDAIRRVTGLKNGGKVSASSRADGIAVRGKTRGKIC